MIRKLLKITAWSLAALFLFVLGCNVWIAFPSWRAQHAVAQYFAALPGVEVLDVSDENEEMPFSRAPEIFVALRIDGATTLELWDLDLRDLEPGSLQPIVLYRIEGNMPQCSGDGVGWSLGVDVRAYPGSGFEALGIRSLPDTVAKHREIASLIASWPSERSAPIPFSTEGGRMERCYRMTLDGQSEQKLWQVLP